MNLNNSAEAFSSYVETHGTEIPESTPQATGGEEGATFQSEELPKEQVEVLNEEPLDAPQETDEELTEQDEENEPVEDELTDDLVIKVKADGRVQEVTLADLKEGYAKSAHYGRKSTQLSDERREFEQERATYAQQYAQQIQTVQQMLFMSDPELAQLQNVDWAKLGEEDPLEYTRLQAKANGFQQKMAHLQAEKQQLDAYQAQQEQQQRQQFAQEQHARFLDANPEYQDDAKRKELVGNVANYMREVGYQDAEISAVADARDLTVLKDAIAYRKLKGELSSKKVTPGPAKTLRSSGKNSLAEDMSRRSHLKKAVGSLKKTGSMRDGVTAFKSFLDLE